MKINQCGLLVLGFVLAFAGRAYCQTNLQFTAIRVTDEGAIHLEWASQSNHVYQVQCASTLINTNTGTITWQMLYDDYPSQGTNTFWLDTGNYFTVPPIPHPSQSPERFYQILDKGPDDLVSDEPTVSITSPTNGFLASGLLTVSVIANTDQGNVYTKLYVDGQAMWLSPDGTNYTINTCEWENGPHVFFATVDSLTQPDGPANSVGLSGHAVSPFVSVVFSNLVTRISFSQPLFQPSLGQTQQVSAIFAANSGWTLNIVDVNSNVVQTATGSGTSMVYNWDGTSGGTNIPDGVYYYYISAATNGGSMDVESGDSSGSGGSPASPALARSSSIGSGSSSLWAVAPDSEVVVPLAIYPPGYDTNGLTIFEASPREIESLISSSSSAASSVALDSGSGGLSADYSGASTQAAPAAPTRPAATPTKGTLGQIGVAYQTYNANGTNPVYADPILDNGLGVQTYVQINNNPGTTHVAYAPFHKVDVLAINFITEMQRGSWHLDYIANDNEVQLSQLKGSGNPFNDVDLGMLIVHGAYGTSFDTTPGHQVKQMYFPIASGTGAQYLRMSDMSLGGPTPTNGLKWMALLACTSLYPKNWNSMQSQNVYPYNSNLHLLLGTATDFGAEPLIGQLWADYMLRGTNDSPMTIRNAWYAAATQAYKIGAARLVAYPNPTQFVVAGDNNCFDDYLQTQTNTVLSGAWHIDTAVQVFP